MDDVEAVIEQATDAIGTPPEAPAEAPKPEVKKVEKAAKKVARKVGPKKASIYRMPGLVSLLAPTIQELRQRLLIRIELFERLAFDAGNNRRYQPFRLSDLDCGDDRAILLEGGEGPARIKRLRHGALHWCRWTERRECHNPRRPPPHSILIQCFGPPDRGDRGAWTPIPPIPSGMPQRRDQNRSRLAQMDSRRSPPGRPRKSRARL